MTILYRCNKFKHQKILKELNLYWNSLAQNDIKRKKKMDYFCCEEYSFFVNRYSISIWGSKELSKEHKDEITQMLQIIFKDKKIKGFVDKISDEESWLLDIFKEIKNIHKVSRDIPNNWTISDLEECREFVSSLTVEEKDKNKKSRLITILNTMIINSKSIDN